LVGRSALVRVDPATGSVGLELPVEGAPDAIAVDESGAVWVSVGTP
jgi:hypothetical protein